MMRVVKGAGVFLPPPQCRQRRRPDPIAQRHRLGALVQQHAHLELLTRDAGQFFQAAQVALIDGGGDFHFDAYQLSSGVLDHHIDLELELVCIPVVHQAIVAVCRGGVLEQLAKNEGLQHIAKSRAILLGFRSAQVEQCGQQAGIDELQLGRFDDAIEPVARPDVDVLEQGPTVSADSTPRHEGGARFWFLGWLVGC